MLSIPWMFGNEMKTWFVNVAVCTNASDMINSLQHNHVLILRLAFAIAVQLNPGDFHEDSLFLHHRCSVWKHGIGWLNRVPVVEVGLLNQLVIVMMRCHKGENAKCAQLHSEIIQKVLEARDEHCKAVKMSVIHSSKWCQVPLLWQHW